MPSDLTPLTDILAVLMQPTITAAVTETLGRIRADEAKLGERLAYPEAEAAALLGVQQHVLRDCRRRGEIEARLCGKKFIYARSELLRFLGDRRLA